MPEDAISTADKKIDEEKKENLPKKRGRPKKNVEKNILPVEKPKRGRPKGSKNKPKSKAMDSKTKSDKELLVPAKMEDTKENDTATNVEVLPPRNEKGQFQQGNNLGGRKPMPAEVKEMFLSAAPSAVSLLINTMDNAEADLDLRIKCAEKILERCFGKAPQPLVADVDSTIRLVLGDKTERFSV